MNKSATELSMPHINLSPHAEYYRKKLLQHGPSAEGMDWKNKESQYLRFDIISRYIDFSKSPSVLDVGCGSAEFLEFCNERGYEIFYEGIDVCADMISACRARFGSKHFKQKEALQLVDSPGEYDYVIASGPFNTKLHVQTDEWRAYFHSCIRSMFIACRTATILNIMSCYVDSKYDRLYYATPIEIGELAVKDLSRNFIIDHSYPLYEMTFAIFKTIEVSFK